MPHDGESRIDKRLYGQVRMGAPPGTRTPNPRIKRDEHRLVYRADGKEVKILKARYHYGND